jgi:hypothetical protein
VCVRCHYGYLVRARAVRDKNEGEEDAEDASLIGADGGTRLRMQGLNHTVAKKNKLAR